MIASFFKTTFRYFIRNKSYSFLNIFGLAIGLACTGLIFLWVEDEINFDQVNLKKDQIYMAMNNWPFEGNYSTFQSTPGQLGPAIKAGPMENPPSRSQCRCRPAMFVAEAARFNQI